MLFLSILLYVGLETDKVSLSGQGLDTPFCDLFVDAVETVRITYLLDKLARNGKYAMLVGNARTGKTEIIRNY